MRCLLFLRVLWLPSPYPSGTLRERDRPQLDSLRNNRPPLGQISPDKAVNCPCTTVPFTVFPEPVGFVLSGRLAPGISAFYDISVRRLTGLPLASSRHSLAGLPLP
jgi:hypothetical protein